MRLSLCMIVRDNRTILEECLTSIRPWVDEMVVVDTGSVDGTAELAERLGARVSHFPWIDDFSAARNASLAEARGEWLFWMDSDDVIDAENGRRLQTLAAGEHAAEVLGYVMQVHCPGAAGAESGDVTVVDHVKLFRNRPNLRFEGRIHEQVLPSLRRTGGEVAWTDIFVTHQHGSVTPQAKARKQTRDLRILELDLAERGEHPFVLFNLGMTYADMERPREAAGFLERSIRASGPHESHLPKAFALLTACWLQAGEPQRAAEVCTAGRARWPEDLELQFRAAVVAHQRRRGDEAISLYQRLLQTKQDAVPRSFTSRDVGIAGHKARHNLAILLAEQQRWPEAELQWRLALDEAPGFQPALLALGQALVNQAKYVTAREMAQKWRDETKTDCAGSLLQAQLAEVQETPQQAIALLEAARAAHPGRSEPLDDLGRLLFTAERFDEAEEVLAALLALRPGDAAAAHNLGSTYLALGRNSEAKAMLQRSLELRPGDTATAQLLAQVGG